MIKKRIFILILCFVTSVLFVTGLVIFANKNNNRQNGFIRLFPPGRVSIKKVFDVVYNSYLISGATPYNFYLTNNAAQGHILKINNSLTDTQHLSLQISDSGNIYNGSVVALDSPHIYLFDGITPAIWEASFSDMKLHKSKKTIYFLKAIPMSNTSFLATSINKDKNRVVVKQSGDSINKVANVLEKQIDGVFCTDGILNYDQGSGRGVYLYYYRNQFLVMDSNLNVQYKGRTIDTISTAKFKIATLEKGKKMTFSSPPLVVNKNSCIYGDWLFVHSALKANNETKKVFDSFSVIDVYSFRDGQYSFSFYLPDCGGKKIRDFKVFDKTLVFLCDHYIYTYQLDF